MLILPKGSLPPRKTTAGFARGSGGAGHWLRARAAVVNPNTDPMSRWRHLFNVGKLTYRATLPGGSNTAPVLGITPQAAWSYLFATYTGILLPGLHNGEIVLPTRLKGCNSVEAFTVMISTTLSQMDLPTPTAPAITTVQAVSSGPTVSTSAGTATLKFIPITNAQVGPISALYSAQVIITGYTIPATPTPPSPAWVTSGTPATQFAMPPNSVVFGNLIAIEGTLNDPHYGWYDMAVTGLPSGTNVTLNEIPVGNRLWIGENGAFTFGLIANSTAAPGTYQGTMTATGFGGTFTYNFTVTILDPSAYTLGLAFSSLPTNTTAQIAAYAGFGLSGSGPASLQDLPSGTLNSFPLAYDPSTSTLYAALYVLFTIDPTTPTGSYTFTAALTGWPTAPAVTPAATVSTTTLQCGQACAPYNLPKSLKAYTVTDAAWNVLGFELIPSYLSTYNDPSQFNGYSLASCWTITASAAYQSNKSAPPTSSWLNILTTGPSLPTPAQFLAAWEENFGSLPPKGKMKIMLQWVDPFTGAPGPIVSKTASWETGTNEGVHTPFYGWPFPQFKADGSGLIVVAPGSNAIRLTVLNGNYYNGTVTFTLKPASYIPTGTPPGTNSLPKGVTGNFDNPTITFTNGVPDNSTTTLTMTAVSGAQQFDGEIQIQITDSAVTTRTYLTMKVTGAVTQQPVSNYLSMEPQSTDIYTAVSSSAALEFDLSNSGPEDMTVSMLTDNTDPDFTIEFAQGDTVAATATPTTITFALATGASNDELAGQFLTSAAYAPAGYNVIDAQVVTNDAVSVTVASTNSPAAMTTAGVAGIINNNLTVPAGTSLAPGTASTIAFVEVAGAFTGTTPQIQVIASAGKNTTYSIINTTPNPGHGFQMKAIPTSINQPVPGTATFDVDFSNTNPTTLTTTLTGSYLGNGVTVTPATSPITIPAASSTVPGTTTVTITIAATAEADLTQGEALIGAGSGGYTAAAGVSFTDLQYGPLLAWPATNYINLHVPGSTTATLSFTNGSTAPATVTLTPVGLWAGLTVTIPTNPLTVPAGTTSSPGTASVTITITAASGTSQAFFGFYVNNSAPGWTTVNSYFINITWI